jgi:hypothetical protein
MKRLRLLAELLFLRHGWGPIVALLLVAAGGWLHFITLPDMLADSARQRQALTLLKTGAVGQAPKTPLVEQRYREFRNQLAQRGTLPEIIKTFFAAARQNGLVLQKMDYSLARPPAGEYFVYRINAPLTGPYPAVRQFAQDILEQVPAAALEEAAFKRSAIGSTATEAKLRFALYLKEDE